MPCGGPFARLVQKLVTCHDFLHAELPSKALQLELAWFCSIIISLSFSSLKFLLSLFREFLVETHGHPSTRLSIWRRLHGHAGSSRKTHETSRLLASAIGQFPLCRPIADARCPRVSGFMVSMLFCNVLFDLMRRLFAAVNSEC